MGDPPCHPLDQFDLLVGESKLTRKIVPQSRVQLEIITLGVHLVNNPEHCAHNLSELLALDPVLMKVPLDPVERFVGNPHPLVVAFEP